MEHLLPVDPVADKALGFTDAITIDSLFFDDTWPMAFADPAQAEAYAQTINSSSEVVTETPAGGVPANPYATALVHLRGNREQTLRITSIRVDPIEKLPPVSNALVCPPLVKGGGDDVELIDFDLDSRTPIGSFVDQDGGVTTTPYFTRRTVTLAKNEVVGFELWFRSSLHHVRFGVIIDYQIGSSERGSIKVDVKGKPFEFTATRQKASAGSKFLKQTDHAPDYESLWLPAPEGPHVERIGPADLSKPLRC